MRAQDHIRFHSYQLRTETLGYSGHRFTKTGQFKNGKMQPGLMKLDFSSGTQVVGSKLGIKSMSPWIQPTLCQRSVCVLNKVLGQNMRLVLLLMLFMSVMGCYFLLSSLLSFPSSSVILFSFFFYQFVLRSPR